MHRLDDVAPRTTWLQGKIDAYAAMIDRDMLIHAIELDILQHIHTTYMMHRFDDVALTTTWLQGKIDAHAVMIDRDMLIHAWSNWTSYNTFMQHMMHRLDVGLGLYFAIFFAKFGGYFGGKNVSRNMRNIVPNRVKFISFWPPEKNSAKCGYTARNFLTGGRSRAT